MTDDLFSKSPRKRRKSPEHTFQAWADRFIDRVVTPPMFTTGIDHASQQTDNARARMAGRGIKFGLPDVFVAQREWMDSHSVWIELKRGSGLSAAQYGAHQALRAAGQKVYVARTMTEVLHALRESGFALHPNADEIAREYEARVTAKESAPAIVRRPGKPRHRPSAAGVARGITTADMVKVGRRSA